MKRGRSPPVAAEPSAPAPSIGGARSISSGAGDGARARRHQRSQGHGAELSQADLESATNSEGQVLLSIEAWDICGDRAVFSCPELTAGGLEEPLCRTVTLVTAEPEAPPEGTDTGGADSGDTGGAGGGPPSPDRGRSRSRPRGGRRCPARGCTAGVLRPGPRRSSKVKSVYVWRQRHQDGRCRGPVPLSFVMARTDRGQRTLQGCPSPSALPRHPVRSRRSRAGVSHEGKDPSQGRAGDAHLFTLQHGSRLKERP